ncbi:YcnI family protein [Priestia aryabhattai]|uniref:YcnI family copper-binding membrane protein n=1 Tax=Priestia TaxID=2800373 RepID=UPI0008DC6268|nr:YcnI family protein [Priestia aryabhattai]MED4156463.1 YcnI family protein [Priestia aryabhattai]OHY76925.1 nuclear export factor GLE1 [Priestia aryabhattai]
MKKQVAVLLSTFILSTIAFAGTASAHVVVYPQEATQGSYEKFTVRVPTEKDIATTKVKVEIPKDVEISRFEPKEGWKYELQEDSSGLITSVTWTATDAGLSPTEFGEFSMQGKVGDNAKKIVWKAYQTYKDGSTVAWEGPADADTPASITTVVKGNGAEGDSHISATNETTAGNEVTNDDSNSALPTTLSIVALVLGIISLILSLRRKKQS